MSASNEEQMTVKANERASIVDGSVWQWIHEASEASPIQPVSNLGTGFVEYNPPSFIRDAHAEALEMVECNQYASINGAEALRKTISDTYSPLYGRQIDPSSEILIASGAQEALLSTVMAFIQPGDEVILVEPVFAMYIYQVLIAGGKIKYVSLKTPASSKERIVSANDWKLDMDELEATITPRTKAIYFNNPHNPLGKVYSRQELLDIGRICTKYNLLLISDEVYERIAFEEPKHCATPGPHIRIASLSPELFSRTLTAVSLGKLFNASGWRLGFLIGPQKLVKAVTNTHAVLAYSSSAPAQQACVKGLQIADSEDWWTKNVRDLAYRCSQICQVLEDIGLTYVAPAGAWFVFVNISRLKLPDDYVFPAQVQRYDTADWRACYFLVQEFGISSIPGSCFYCTENAHLGADWLRFGTCKSDEGLALARDRLRQVKRYIS